MIYAGLLVSFCLLIFSALRNIFIGYALFACWLLFALISLKKGYTLKETARMSLAGGGQSFVVLRILILIGAAIGTWTGAGTIPAIVYYGLNYAAPTMPHTFALAAFLICCAASFLTGTAFGTVSAVGIPLMIIARSGNANLDLIAGAAIAGAYFGDRCSPMSSSACLVANLTGTGILTNIRNMLRTAAVPFLLSLGFYYVLSAFHPLQAINSGLSGELAATFNIQPVLLLPAVIMLVLSLCRVSIDISILISILAAAALGVFYQHHQLTQVIGYLILGFKADTGPLQNIVAGGGILSMLKTCAVVFVACSLAGICSGIKVFDGLKEALSSRRLARRELFGATSAVSVATAAFGCSQTVSVVMTGEIVKDSYRGLDNHQLALDLHNSSILLAALIPWNLAALVPTTAMDVSAAGFIPYAFFLYAVPITHLVSCRHRRGAAGSLAGGDGNPDERAGGG